MLLYAGISHYFVVSGFARQETDERVRDMRICTAVLQSKFQELKDTAVVTDTGVRFVSSEGLSPAFRRELVQWLEKHAAELDETRNGFARVGSDIYLVVVGPIGKGEARDNAASGFVRAARLDKETVDELARTTNCEVALYVDGGVSSASPGMAAGHLPSDTTSMYPKALNTHERLIQRRRDGERVFVWQRLCDWKGRPIAALVTSTSRHNVLKNSRAVGQRSLLIVLSSLLTLLVATLQIRAALLAQGAHFDELTGLHNHRYLQERLAQEVTRAIRYSRPLAVAMLDIDHFKTINDVYSHLVGDETLTQLAIWLKETVRDTDVVTRYGGEEFFIIMPETDSFAAVEAMERVRRKVEESVVHAKVAAAKGRGASKVTVQYTVSIGVASFPEHAMSVDELVMAADLALFAAKRSSRNAVKSYDVVCDQAGCDAHDPASIHAAMKEGTLSVVGALAAAIDARDERMRGHSEKVASCALTIGRVLGLAEVEMNTLRTAAFLHDVGAIAIPDSILRKPGELTCEERLIVSAHSTRGAEILANAPQLAQVAKVVRHHHERFDGKGYPDGLAGEEIPIESRIIAVADAFDAITTDRAYRMGSSREEAVALLRRDAGAQFDPRVVDALDHVVQGNHLPGQFRSDIRPAA